MRDEQQGAKPSWADIVKSTLAAALGVQSSKNRERDFSRGSLPVYIVSGIIFTALFITVLVVIVRIIVARSGV